MPLLDDLLWCSIWYLPLHAPVNNFAPHVRCTGPARSSQPLWVVHENRVNNYSLIFAGYLTHTSRCIHIDILQGTHNPSQNTHIDPNCFNSASTLFRGQASTLCFAADHSGMRYKAHHGGIKYYHEKVCMTKMSAASNIHFRNTLMALTLLVWGLLSHLFSVICASRMTQVMMMQLYTFAPFLCCTVLSGLHWLGGLIPGRVLLVVVSH